MKKCPDCAELVQDDARVCRYCRYEFPPAAPAVTYQKEQPRGRSMGCISLSVGAIVLLFIAVAIDPASKTTSSNKTNDAAAADSRRSNSAATESTQTTKATTEADKPASKYADGGKQFAWIDTSEDAIRNQLKDPDSAIFRNVHFYSGGGIPVACGEVNAKNGFGGYTGFERFVAAGDTLAVTESQVQGGLGPVWKKYCVRAPTDAR